MMGGKNKSKYIGPTMYKCQFCEKETSARDWKDDKCPICKREYDVQLAQDSEE